MADLDETTSVPCTVCGGGELVDDPDLQHLLGTLDEDGEPITAGQLWMPCPHCMDPVVGPTGVEPPANGRSTSLVAQIADQLTAMDGLDRDDKYTQMMRVTKLAEEVGEAAEALIAFHNVNPRKPAGPLADVIKELCDVALTAKVSIENFGFDAETVLAAREQEILDRLNA